jgi:hypothetical protein
MTSKTALPNPDRHRRADSRGELSRRHGAGWLLLGFLALAFVLIPSTALARTTRLPQASFGSLAGAGVQTTAAVDQATGDVFIVSNQAFSGSVARFTAAGAPDNFTSGPDAGSNTLTAAKTVQDVVVDNSTGPLHGDIYLVESTKVKIFAEDGTPLGELDGSGTADGSFNSAACGVAIDATSSDLYIAESRSSSGEPRIWRYAPNSPGGAIDESGYAITGIIPDHQICSIAVDESNGHLYGADANSGGEKALLAYPTAPFATHPLQIGAVEQLTQSVLAIALDPVDGQVYADEGDRVSVFDPSGTALYHFGSGADFGGISAGIALQSNSPGPAATVYVTDPVDHRLDTFGATTQVTALTHPAIAAFGSDGTSGSVFSGLNGEVVDGFAFDQVARRLYVASGSEVFGFDVSTLPDFVKASIPAFPNPGASPGLAVDNTALSSAGNVYLATGREGDGLIYGFDSAGNALGGSFPIDPASTPGAPEGSPEELCGAAVDSAGDLFVANHATKHVLEYSSAGTFLGAIDTSAQGSGPCALAFASNDDLYASLGSKGVWRYTVASAYSSATRIAKGNLTGSQPGIAVDSSTGDLFVGGGHGSEAGLAVSAWIDQYDSAGNFVDEFDPGTEGMGSIPDLSVDPTDHDLYIGDGNKGVVRVFGPGVILPEVSAGAPSAIANTQATLTGSVDDQADSLTDCHFEYVSEAAFRLTGFSDLASGGTVPCTPSSGSIPNDLNDHPVTASAVGLTVNTGYRYRLSASNANGTIATLDHGFTTAGPPIVETVGSPIRTATTARLDSRVDPREQSTTYHFEYGTHGPCGANPCMTTTPQSGGEGNLTRLVSTQISGLQPATTYDYRVVADNGNPDGPSFGADRTLVTRDSDAPLTHGAFPGPPGSDRAWEQVNAADTGGNPVFGAEAISDEGDRAVYQVSGGTPFSDTGSADSQFFAQRTATGWQTQSIHPPRAQASSAEWSSPAANGDLSTLLALNESPNGFDLWRLQPGGSPFKLVADRSVWDLDVSENASRVLVALRGSLDPSHPFVAQPGASYLYDVTTGTPQLVGLLPDQTVPACGLTSDNASEDVAFSAPNVATRSTHWLSPNGDLAYFPTQGDGPCNSTVTGTPSELYVRDLLAGTTTRVSPPPLSGPACSAAFIKSTPGAVFFWSRSRLAPQDIAPASCGGKDNGDVYRYDLAGGSVDCVTCAVPGLAADIAQPPTEAAQQIAVAGDGSRVYFQSAQHLLPGTPQLGESAIYRVTVAGGALAFVAPGAGTVVGDSPSFERSALTPDGSVLIFRSANSSLDALTGSTNAGIAQYYRYDDRERSLICASCPGDGSAPRAAVPEILIAGGSEDATAEASPNKTPLDANGDFFFPTPTALTRGDKNTAAPGDAPESGDDIYEWRDGQQLLITDGATTWPTTYTTPVLSGVDPSGHDVFFTEAAQLTPDAPDAYARLYDARIGGGFEFPAPKPPCPLAECQGVPAPTPDDPFAATLSFQGPGNQIASPSLPPKCGKGDVLRSGRCVPVPCPKKEVHRNGKCVPVPCPKKEVRRNGKCARKVSSRNRRRHTAARPVRSHR